MPSDASGNYSLPPGYLAVTGETIQASQHNPPLEDLASSMSARVMTTGATPLTGPLKLSNGTASAPAITFASATNIGFFLSANGIGVAINGALAFELTSISAGVPVGAMMDWGFSLVPTGWLLCQGQSLARSSYPALFAAIGTGFGSVDGNSFSIPDLRGVVTAGYDPNNTRLSGSSNLRNIIGVESAAITQGQLPNYTLPKTLAISDTTNYTVNGGSGLLNTSAGSQFGGGPVGATQNVTLTKTGAVTITGDTQSGGAGDVLTKVQPTMILAKIIFAGA